MVNDFEPLPPKALTVIRLRLLAPAGFVIVVLLVGAVAAFLGDVAGATTYGLVLAAVAVLVLAGWWVFSGLVFRAYGWKLTDGTVELRHGVVVQRHQARAGPGPERDEGSRPGVAGVRPGIDHRPFGRREHAQHHGA